MGVVMLLKVEGLKLPKLLRALFDRKSGGANSTFTIVQAQNWGGGPGP